MGIKHPTPLPPCWGRIFRGHLPCVTVKPSSHLEENACLAEFILLSRLRWPSFYWMSRNVFCGQSHVPGWLGWPRASPEGSRLKSYRLGLNSVGLSVGVGRWGGGRWSAREVTMSFFWAFLLCWVMQTDYRLRALFGTCADVLKRWLLWFCSVQSHLKPLYFQIGHSLIWSSVVHSLWFYSIALFQCVSVCGGTLQELKK